MHEDVFGTIVRYDEPEALGGVEEFDLSRRLSGSGGHGRGQQTVIQTGDHTDRSVKHIGVCGTTSGML